MKNFDAIERKLLGHLIVQGGRSYPYTIFRRLKILPADLAAIVQKLDRSGLAKYDSSQVILTDKGYDFCMRNRSKLLRERRDINRNIPPEFKATRIDQDAPYVPRRSQLDRKRF